MRLTDKGRRVSRHDSVERNLYEREIEGDRGGAGERRDLVLLWLSGILGSPLRISEVSAPLNLKHLERERERELDWVSD